jgi:uncharacterized protein YkwD
LKPYALDWLESTIEMKGIPSMKVRLAGLATLCCAIVLTLTFSNSFRSQSQNTKVSSGSGLSQPEQDLLNEINQARAHPGTYASYLEGLKPLFKGKVYTRAGQPGLTTEEAGARWKTRSLSFAPPNHRGPLTVAQGLSLAALTHCKDQGQTGNTGHKGADSTFIEERVKPFGTWQGGIGENISYGRDSARERLLTWLIDDGFPSRGHRMRVMSENYRVTGVSCGPHPEFGMMCVLELAGGFIDSTTVKTATSNQTKSSGTLKNSPPAAKLSVTTQTQKSGAANNNTGAKTSTSGNPTNTNKSMTTTKPR